MGATLCALLILQQISSSESIRGGGNTIFVLKRWDLLKSGDIVSVSEKNKRQRKKALPFIV